MMAVQQIAALAAPPLLIVSMLWAFRSLHRRFGYPLGYLLGFVVYWVGWCFLVPYLLLSGWNHLIDLFSPMPSFATLDWTAHLMLWLPLLFPLIFVFIPRLRRANLAILVASVVLGIVIGITEEVLWRGVYIRIFPDNPWLNLVYPTVMFALWHICPLSIQPSKMAGGTVSFVVYAFFLGLFYILVVYQTGSIAWSAVSHILHDILGLGGFAYAAWLMSGSTNQTKVKT